ncbi:MAG: tetratricopeptide repeat protein [Bacteroidetes bacterium]|nr:tetratricopeptide repeat protein [Bacteroidota bacterium]
MSEKQNLLAFLKSLIFLLLPVFIAVTAYSSENQLLIAKGNTAYSSGKYQEAIVTYSSLVSQGLESTELFYNLGNSYFKLNDIPHAILWYERAKRLDPGNEDVNFNLNVANSRITDKIEPLPEFFVKRWLKLVSDLFPMDTWAIAGVAFLIASLFMFLLYLASRVLLIRKLGFWLGFSTLLLSVVFLFFAWGSYRSMKSDQSAIIINPTVTVKSSPDEKSTDIFVIHEGCKVQIVDHIGNWYEIRIVNGSVGWVEQDKFEKI